MSVDTSDGDINYHVLRKSGIPQGFECADCGAQGGGVDDVDHDPQCQNRSD